MRTLRVFLADDHTVVREGLKALIDHQVGMKVIGEAGDGLQAIKSTCKAPWGKDISSDEGQPVGG